MIRVLGAAVVAVSAGVVSAQPETPDPDPARARLVSEFEALVPGQTAWLGVSFDLEPEWHLYWNGQSDTGMPISLKFDLPEGYKAGELLWPAPKRHISPGDLLDHVYEKRVTLLLPVTVPADAEPGSTASFKGDGSWLVCKTVCLMGSAEFSLAVPIAKPGEVPKPSKDAALFAQTRSRLPKPLPTNDAPVRLVWSGNELRINADNAKSLAFYPGPECGAMADLIGHGEAKGGTLTLTADTPQDKARIQGVLEIRPQSGAGAIVYQIDTKPPVNPRPPQPSNQPTPIGG